METAYADVATAQSSTHTLDIICNDYLAAVIVTGHRSNILDNQCGATITNSSVGGASLPLCKRADEGKQLEMD
uniref:Uncharacterized protein n=1 Tax=Hyaloperonospora arabidopsidis (strain Emoy2) TaxID=559515 RepID=M4C0C1_HYAAE